MPILHPTPLYSRPLTELNSSNNRSKRLQYGIASWGLYRQNVGVFFPKADLFGPISSRTSSGLDAILAWGNKPSTLSASALASRLSIPLLRVEDGFLYGIGPSSIRMSLVIDDLGIYYDATTPSRLESLISSASSYEQIERAQSLRGLWIDHGVSKYNHAPSWVRPVDGWYCEPFILLIDQTRGDQSIAGSLADASSFSTMLDAALAQTAIDHIMIKIHPEVVSGKKQGHFDLSPASPIGLNPRIRVMSEDYSLPSVIQEASATYTVSSQAGFEALIWDKPVHTFGMPFYAGWGLTHDHLCRPERRCNASIEQLIYAALITYPRYVHPETNHLCEVEDLIEYVGFQRQARHRFGMPLLPIGFTSNKLKHLRRFTQGARLDNPERLSQPSHGTTYSQLLWGSNLRSLNPDEGENKNTIGVEDGFIRSIGLGAALATPFSWVFDERGIYYDARSPSDLEYILQFGVFDNDTMQRATSLKHEIKSLGMSKYNLTESNHAAHEVTSLKDARQEYPTKRFLLVTGQVESDASIEFGGVDIFKNSELLSTVRLENPDACIIYKPHPDIARSVRFTGGSANDHEQYYDLIVSDLSLNECLKWIDELHTISSLSGFEALIRGTQVTCYGLPFYAGWGLTTDRHQLGRRTKKLSVVELVAGTLIKYPTYIHPKSGLYCTPEALIYELQALKTSRIGIVNTLYRYCIEFGLKLAMGVFHRIKGI